MPLKPKPKPPTRPVKPRPEDAPEIPSLSTAELLDRLHALLTRHVIAPPDDITAMALWVLFAHTSKLWLYSPRLVLTSPTFRCGKSTALMVLRAVCPNGRRISNATEAAIFHLIDEHKTGSLTLLLDECDTFFEDTKTLQGVMNGGFEQGSELVRCEKSNQDGREKYYTQSFKLATPIVLAGIGDKWVWPALLDRSIHITMTRKRPEEPTVEFDERDPAAVAELKELRLAAVKWAKGCREELRKIPARFPPHLNDRAMNAWRPLLAVAEHAGEEWWARASAAALRLSGDGNTPEDEALKVLTVAKDILTRTGKLYVTTQSICDEIELHKDDLGFEETMDTKRVAGVLRPYGIVPTRMREGDRRFRAMARERFVDAWLRFLPVGTPEPLAGTPGTGQGG